MYNAHARARATIRTDTYHRRRRLRRPATQPPALQVQAAVLLAVLGGLCLRQEHPVAVHGSAVV